MACLFCKIINKEIPATIVYEDDEVLAFDDIAPKAPTHILVIPKKHVAGIAELEELTILPKLFAVMKKLAVQKSLDKSGYRIVVNQGRDGGQAVPHLHFHLLGGRSLTWPPG
ncbi:MAG: histidine triad nucleotide-binding protein [Candidatus Margulisbacteria bacterium]|nr:histidine triad nucleotide-binding protein [Candidatus Margulisiibacteriota bacterium]